MPFDFSYFILICKLYKVPPEAGRRHKKKNKKKEKQGGQPEPDVLWSNPEEELFNEVADCWFEFCVKGDSDSGLSGTWQEDDVEMTPYRRVLLFQADKIDSVIDRIKTFVGQ
uniref:Uncharacterized protein n=1 Tax=Timema monikensis TaxID=170555 RepID=A0A7R9EB41_9NEOP|nr:unnamed protein product [Timema monikensis]